MISAEELQKLSHDLDAFNQRQKAMADGTLVGEELQEHLQHIEVLKLAKQIVEDPRK